MVKVRSAAETVEKLTALLKVTVIALGETVTVDPLAGLVETTRKQVDGVDRVDGVDHAEARLLVPGAGRLAVHRQSRRSIKPWRIWAGVSVGTSWSIKAATAAALGAADEVPKKLGRFCDRFVPSRADPGTEGCCVSMIWPGEKNEVLPPSGAVIDGVLDGHRAMQWEYH